MLVRSKWITVRLTRNAPREENISVTFETEGYAVLTAAAISLFLKYEGRAADNEGTGEFMVSTRIPPGSAYLGGFPR